METSESECYRVDEPSALSCSSAGSAQHAQHVRRGLYSNAHLEIKLPAVEALVQNLQLHIRVHASG